jgi:hypothetical protein
MKTLIFSESNQTPVTLKQIPRSQYMGGPVCSAPLDNKSRYAFFKLLRKKSRTSKPAHIGHSTHNFSAAAWLSFDHEIHCSLKLLITYEDALGEQHALVDTTDARGTRSVMLSGQVTLEVQGDLESLKVECLGLPADTRCWVDDVHFQKKESTTPQAHSA